MFILKRRSAAKPVYGGCSLATCEPQGSGLGSEHAAPSADVVRTLQEIAQAALSQV